MIEISIDFNPEIKIAFTATQIILVFVIFLFTLFYRDIQDAWQKKPKEDGTNAKYNVAENVKEVFWSKSIILVLSSLLVFLVFLPAIFQIFINWIYNSVFDYISWCGTLIFLFISCFLYWSIKLSYLLFGNIKELRGLDNVETTKYILENKKKS